MHKYSARLRNFATVAAATLLLAVSASAQTKLDVPQIHVQNFGRLNDHYYRGAQPTNSDYGELAAIGVKTVIDLTQDGRSDEPGLVKRAGMSFYRIPLTTSAPPS